MAARKGTEHHLSKLNPELVREMRALREEGATYPEIMEWLLVERDTDITLNTAGCAVRGITWTHVR